MKMLKSRKFYPAAMDTLCYKNSNFDVFIKILVSLTKLPELWAPESSQLRTKIILYSYMKMIKSLKFYPAAMDILTIKNSNFSVFIKNFSYFHEIIGKNKS
jgi:hypothetical protein